MASPGRPSSTLSYRELGQPWGVDAVRVIALGDGSHAAGEWVTSLLPHMAVRVLDAPRRADPRRFGTPTDPGDWFVDAEGAPDPHAFHVSLLALERVVEEEPGVALVGVGQGAALCLTLSCCWPDRLAAVVACGDPLPELPAGGIVERPLSGLPVLCIEGSAVSAPALQARGGCVETHGVWDAARVACWLCASTGGSDDVPCCPELEGRDG